jgi:hypothetical protein
MDAGDIIESEMDRLAMTCGILGGKFEIGGNKEDNMVTVSGVCEIDPDTKIQVDLSLYSEKEGNSTVIVEYKGAKLVHREYIYAPGISGRDTTTLEGYFVVPKLIENGDKKALLITNNVMESSYELDYKMEIPVVERGNDEKAAEAVAKVRKTIHILRAAGLFEKTSNE